MSSARFHLATMRPARFIPEDLGDYVISKFNAEAAARKASARSGRQFTSAAFMRRLNRMAATLGYKSLQHLMVWYELEYKGWQNACGWKARLDAVFSVRAALRHEHAIGYLKQLLEMAEKEGSFCVKALRTTCNSDTVCRRIRALTDEAGVDYSLRWVVYLYALHTALQARPELLCEPSPTRTGAGQAA